MKISSNYQYKVNFGYDKQLNEELKTKLKTYPDRAWAQTISSMNTLCNKLETNIEKEEKKDKESKKSSDSKLHDYLDIFLSTKQMLAGYVSITFEDMNYADREYLHYQDEFKKTGETSDNWRKDAFETLETWLSPELSKKIKKDDAPAEAVPKNQQQVQQEELQSESSFETALKSMTGLGQKSFLEEFKPSSSTPKGFSEVAGMAELKDDLSQNVIEYIKNPQQAQLDFEEYGKTIPKGILLYGPPGCGKTYITQALASEIEVPLYLLNISKAGSHYINMTSKNIKAAFDEAIKLAESSGKPCLLFMDEIDSLGFDRSSRMEPDDLKQVSTMLQSIDAAKDSNVIIIGATNKYNLLDPAIRRRFDSKVFVDVPDLDSIKALLVKNLTPLRKGHKLLENPDDLEEIAKKLKGYSNSSICNISKEAALYAMKRGRADIAIEDYDKAIKASSEEKPDSKIYKPDSLRQNHKMGFSI